ncbi:MAG: hypothetical protein FWG75_07810 [Cystobacterineae bacterium]|nr:hypothetical protein [Cystobacterineae bacterium]
MTTCQKTLQKAAYVFENTNTCLGLRFAGEKFMEMFLRLRRLLFLGLFLLSTAGVAQTLSLSFSSFGSEQEWVFGKSACNSSFSVFWLFNPIYRTACSGLQLWVSTQSCSDTESRVDLFNIPSDRTDFLTGSRTVALSSLPGFKGELSCGAENVQIEHYICGEILLRDMLGNCNNDPEKVSSNTLSVVYKTTAPPAPLINSSEGYDGEITIRFSASGDYLNEVLLYGKRSGSAEDFEEMGRVNFALNAISASGLENNTPYTFFLQSVDLAGNKSPNSELIEESSVHTDGFWDVYKQNGGASGSCRVAGGGLSGLGLVFLGLCLGRRRRPC